MFIFGQDVDLNKNEVKQLRVGNLLGFPTVVAADKGYTFFHTGQNLPYMYDGASWLALANQPGSGITGIETQDDGSTILASSKSLNFTGAGVIVTDLGSGKTGIAISGTTFNLKIEKDDSQIVSAASTLNFLGSNVLVVDAGLGQVDITFDSDFHLDGGRADSVYIIEQIIDGGGA